MMKVRLKYIHLLSPMKLRAISFYRIGLFVHNSCTKHLFDHFFILTILITYKNLLYIFI